LTLDPALRDALASSQRLGLLGARPIDEVIDHAGAFVAAIAGVTGTVVDLGTGGGVPGLVIAAARPDLRLLLVDRKVSRTDHVRRLVRRLGWHERITVLTADAAGLVLDRPVDAAVARGFGPPDVTLHVGARLVRLGGLIVVSEPPDRRGRWSAGLLADAGVAMMPSPDPRVATLRRSTWNTSPSARG
jgi:16S rRNA (guanine527-N7)-methyltransferase